jgi:P-type E1-E2 ATPase
MYYNNQMLEIQFPVQRALQLNYLVCDINGTLTIDGELIEGVQTEIISLKSRLEIFLLSADTLGKADSIAAILGVKLHKIQPGNEAQQKAAFLSELGAAQTAAIGQGANDELMLKQAALGICVLSAEGTASAALLAAKLVVPNILTAFELFKNPLRITATLRE